jgi:phosphoserine phosphatase
VQIILVRHGQTEWNLGERFRGRTDLELTALGLRQAEATARHLARWPVSAVYASPLKRAMKTGETIAGHLGLQIEPHEGLIDMDFGSWQGLSLAEAEKSDPSLYHVWVESPHLVTFPDGEGLAQIRQRVDSVLKGLRESYKDETVVLVSHKVVCKVMALFFLGLDNSRFWQVEQDLCAINIFSVGEDRSFVMRLNDTCHLRDLGD